MAKAEKAAAKLGGMSGRAAKAIMSDKRRKKSRLDAIMNSMPSRRNAQSTDSNNRR
jgi:hypothetical protein